MFYFPDKIEIDFSRGRILLGTIAHEGLHLLLRQNDWLDKYPFIKELSSEHELLRISKFGWGYQIEQMIAYLIQRDVNRLVGEKFSDNSLLRWGDKTFFDKVIEEEFTYENAHPEEKQFLINLGRNIINLWDENPDKHDLGIFLELLVSTQ